MGQNPFLATQPFFGDQFDRIGDLFGSLLFLPLFFFCRVDAVGEQLAGLVSPCAGVSKADFGIAAQREEFLFAIEVVLEPPGFPRLGFFVGEMRR